MTTRRASASERAKDAWTRALCASDLPNSLVGIAVRFASFTDARGEIKVTDTVIMKVCQIGSRSYMSKMRMKLIDLGWFEHVRDEYLSASAVRPTKVLRIAHSVSTVEQRGSGSANEHQSAHSPEGSPTGSRIRNVNVDTSVSTRVLNATIKAQVGSSQAADAQAGARARVVSTPEDIALQREIEADEAAEGRDW